MSDLNAIAEQLAGDAGLIHAAAKYLTSPMILAELREALHGAVVESDSPFVDRFAAAKRWYCSESEIDRVSKPSGGVLTKYMRGGTPMFLKAQGDQAILDGTWVASRHGPTENKLRLGLKRAA